MAKKSNWESKVTALKQRKPELNNIDWSKILREDPEVLNGIVNGVVRVDENRKAKLDKKTGTRRLHNLIQNDFSEKEFSQAFSILCRDETIRTTAQKIEASPAHVYNLKEGKAEPTAEMMENIAKVYGRKPEYFIEYRVTSVLATLDSFLKNNPETATIWFSKLNQKKGISIK